MTGTPPVPTPHDPTSTNPGAPDPDAIVVDMRLPPGLTPSELRARLERWRTA